MNNITIQEWPGDDHEAINTIQAIVLTDDNNLNNISIPLGIVLYFVVFVFYYANTLYLVH